MTDEAAGFYEWARRTAITSDDAWEEMQAVNEETEWDVEEMLGEPDDYDVSGSAHRQERPQ